MTTSCASSELHLSSSKVRSFHYFTLQEAVRGDDEAVATQNMDVGANTQEEPVGSAQSSEDPPTAQTVPKKRIFVCCDGTWNDSISTSNPMTNVAKISRCIAGVADDGAIQIVYYATGVGTRSRGLGSGIDGATGRGQSLLD